MGRPLGSTVTPKYRKHKASGQAVVTIAGKDHYLGPHGTLASRREHDRLIGQWLANGRAFATVGDVSNMFVAQLLAAFKCHAESYYVDDDGNLSTEYAHMEVAWEIMQEIYGRTLIADFGPLALKAVRQQMIDKGWVRTSINHNINRVRHIFKWGTANVCGRILWRG